MANPYSPGECSLTESFRRIHANGEQTHVAIMQVGEREHVALAVDLWPAEYEGLAAAPIAYGPTEDDAAERARRWMESNPKGVAPGEDGGGDGLGAKVWGALKRLDDYGNDLVDEQTQAGKGGGDNS